MGTLFRRTARLFAKPSFLGGIARVLDIGATLNEYNTDPTPADADSEALKSDWAAVADEMYSAVTNFEKQQISEEGNRFVRSAF